MLTTGRPAGLAAPLRSRAPVTLALARPHLVREDASQMSQERSVMTSKLPLSVPGELRRAGVGVGGRSVWHGPMWGWAGAFYDPAAGRRRHGLSLGGPPTCVAIL